MAREVKRRRGSTATHETFIGAEGELTVDTDKKTVVVHDGATAGGFPLAREDATPDLDGFVQSQTIFTIVKLFQEDYDALNPKDENTLYVIVPFEVVMSTGFFFLNGNDMTPVA